MISRIFGYFAAKTSPRPQPYPLRNILEPLVSDDKGDKSSKGCKKPQEYLHVLTLQAAEARSSANRAADKALEALKEQLTLAEKFLASQTSYNDQRAYKRCGDATIEDVYSYLVKQASQVEEKANDSIRVMHEERIELFNAANDIFQLFFPVTFDGPTTGKYWGAVKSLVKVTYLGIVYLPIVVLLT